MIATGVTVRRLINLLNHDDVEILKHVAKTLLALALHPGSGSGIASAGVIVNVAKLVIEGSNEQKQVAKTIPQVMVLRNDDESLCVGYAIVTLLIGIQILMDPEILNPVLLRLERFARTPANKPLIVRLGGVNI